MSLTILSMSFPPIASNMRTGTAEGVWFKTPHLRQKKNEILNSIVFIVWLLNALNLKIYLKILILKLLSHLITLKCSYLFSSRKYKITIRVSQLGNKVVLKRSFLGAYIFLISPFYQKKIECTSLPIATYIVHHCSIIFSIFRYSSSRQQYFRF